MFTFIVEILIDTFFPNLVLTTKYITIVSYNNIAFI